NPADAALAQRNALRCERARAASRFCAKADHRAQIHQALRIAAGRAHRQQRIGERPELARDLWLAGKSFDAEAAGEDALDVPVEDRGPPTERERGDRGGGRATHAGQILERRDGRPESATTLADSSRA